MMELLWGLFYAIFSIPLAIIGGLLMLMVLCFILLIVIFLILNRPGTSKTTYKFETLPGVKPRKPCTLPPSRLSARDLALLEYDDDYDDDDDEDPFPDDDEDSEYFDMPGYEISGKQVMLEDEERFYGMDYGYLDDDD